MKSRKVEKNYLDERQEQMLLQVEHRGCWLAFWGLLIALIVQFILGRDFTYMAGEWIVFMVLSVYIVGACARRGIWDRRFKPDVKTNLMFSIVGAVSFGVIVFGAVYHRFPDTPVGSIASGVFAAGFVFVLIFVSLSTVAKIVTEKQRKLETESDMEENFEANKKFNEKH